ncbi:PIN domain-containing protein [Sinirhodobacter populi]|uniref:PIN domain-containing protein n=1 Tax=Paenirhodobacter populi TaxID=2306993 RepID=A0A443K021_9RHOB|nr:PIN domain-containing protein [Sinirhodobacter populi]RWR26065.1 PIN domain-containing protein [Sinirhodobacter populi]
MLIDASVILNHEADAGELVGRLDGSKTRRLFSPVSRFEAIVSLARSRSGKHATPSPEQLEAAVDLFLKEAEASSVMIKDDIGAAALKAARSYGKIVGSKADLNLGDCFAYGCAKAHRVPLLYGGW